MSFPPGTEMFQFPGFALNPYGFRVQSPHGPRSPSPRSPLDSRYGVEGGLPHSEIPGSKLVRSSPRLIAAYHVLHRLSAPRHPPNALKTLDRSHDRCPPLGSAGHRVQKDHFHPQPARNANGAQRIEDGACRTRPSTPGGRGPPQASDMFPLYDVKHPPTASAAANSKSGHRPPGEPGWAPGGARRDRTDDLMLAKHALSQLSYGPILGSPQAPAQASACLADAPWGAAAVRPCLGPGGPRFGCAGKPKATDVAAGA